MAALVFSGYLQPPTVPPDPIGDNWRGLVGATGPTGPVGATGPAGTINTATLPTSNAGLPAGTIWLNGGFLCVA